MSDINRPSIQRANYFRGQTLQTDDFVCEQQYNMELRTLLNSSLHTWGIAGGLTVSRQGGNQLKVDAGMAIDQDGRQIVLSAPQIVQLEAPKEGETVYLTIRFHEVYANYSDESGVPGYKRVVQQPLLEYLPTLEQPGIKIPLAMVRFSAQGSIDDLTFDSEKFERRHVGSRVGSIQLIAEGAENESTGGVLLQALRGPNGTGDCMEVNGTVKALSFEGDGSKLKDLPIPSLGAREPISIGTGNLTCTGTAATDGFIVASFGPEQDDQQVPDFFGMLSCTLPRGVVYKTSASFEFHQDENGSIRNPLFGTLSVPVRKGERWALALDIKRSHNCTLSIQAHWVPFGPSY
jgi:hypothetical protein